MKIESVNTAYYTLSKAIDEKGLLEFLRQYNQLQGPQGPHGETHPFGPMVLYWMLRGLLGDNPGAVGAAYQVMTALVVIPVAKIGEAAYENFKVGLAAALIYLTSPLNLMLSSAGIDAMVALMIALTLASLSKAARENSWWAALLAGVWLFVGTLFSFGVNAIPAFGGLWLAALVRRRDERVVSLAGRVARIAAWWLGSALILHGLLHLALGGQFSYRTSMLAAQNSHVAVNVFRGYSLWSWANVLLYAGYAGAGLTAAALSRGFAVAYRMDRDDGYTWISTVFVWSLIFAAMGRGEIQRVFLFGGVLLAVPAARWMASPAVGPARAIAAVSPGRMTMLLGANVATMVALQIYTLDFW